MADVESSVLTAVLRDKQSHILLQENAERLFKTHLDIWHFIRDYLAKNGSLPPEEIVVKNFDDFDPPDSVGTTKHHLAELKGEYIDTEVRSILRRAANKVQEGDPSGAISDMVNGSNALTKETAAVKDLDLQNADAIMAHLEKVRTTNATGGYGIKTGFSSLDMALPAGISEGFYGILLSYPARGKSWVALMMAVEAWRQGKSPLIVSLEMSHWENSNRIFTILGQGMWTLTDLSRGNIDKDSFMKWHKATFDGRPPLNIISTEGLGEVTPSILAGKISQYDSDFLILDYIQLASPNYRSDNETTKLKSLSRELKMLAQSTKVPILAVSSATPTDVTKMSEPPSIGQTAYSRSLSYDADFMIALGREDTSDVIEFRTVKNRHGPSPTWFVQCDFNRGVFNEMAAPD